MTVTTGSSQFTAPAATPIPQKQITIQHQNKMAPIPQTQDPIIALLAQQVNTLVNQNAVAQASQPTGTSKKQPKNDPYTCILCRTDKHVTANCPKFPTPKEKRDELWELYRCLKCAEYMDKGVRHKCQVIKGKCRTCDEWHWEWLCRKTKQSK